MSRRFLAALTVVALAATGCWQSTLQAARHRKDVVIAEPALSIARNPLLDVRIDAILQDANATAVVVSVTNKDPHRAAVWTPIAVKLKDAYGNIVASNTAGGNDPTLTHFPSLPPGGTAYYVDDQFPTGLGATSASVSLGGTLETLPSPLPHITVANLSTSSSGGLTQFDGTVQNDSNVLQSVLIVQAVARRGDRIVAAGTAIVRNLAPGQSQPFVGFLIGNARGASVSVFAPPTAAR